MLIIKVNEEIMKYVAFGKIFEKYEDAVEYAENNGLPPMCGGSISYENILTSIFEIEEEDIEEIKLFGGIS